MRVDAHQHFWKFDPVRDSWITNEMNVIRKDFLPQDLAPLLKKNKLDGCVAVQADPSDGETDFLLRLAGEFDFIKGVVGWIDLQAPDMEHRLDSLQQYPALKGFRHILQSEQDRAFMLRPEFKRGIRALNKFGYAYDLLILPDQLKYAIQLVQEFPDQKFVIDHLAKPLIRQGITEPWKQDMMEIAQYENVYCKLSGMVTEADWNNWQQDQIRPYLDIAAHAFGAKRILFGSDWPVCLLAASFEETLAIVEDFFSSFSERERALVFGGNAVEFYQLK
jgi:L-fuconolactonase